MTNSVLLFFLILVKLFFQNYINFSPSLVFLYFVFKQSAFYSHKQGLLSTSSIKVTTSYLNNVHILTTKNNHDWKDILRFQKRERETDSNQVRTIKITNRWPSPTTLYLRVKGLIKKHCNRQAGGRSDLRHVEIISGCISECRSRRRHFCRTGLRVKDSIWLHCIRRRNRHRHRQSRCVWKRSKGGNEPTGSLEAY